MSEIWVNSFKNENGNGAPSFPNGLEVTGVVTASTLNQVTSGILTAATLKVTGNTTINGNLGVGGTITYEDVARVDATGLSTFREGFKVGPLTGIAATHYADGSIRTTGIITATSFSGGLPITNGADNRVITASSATALSGESNVNINGGILIAGHTASTTVSNGEGPFLQVKSTDSRGGISLIRHSANAAGGGVYIGKSRNATIGSNTVVQSGDELGRITFSGDDGTDIHTEAAKIVASVDGTPGSNDMPGRIQFYTTADGAASPTERFRIGSAGQFGIGGATYGSSGQVLTSGGASAPPTWAAASAGKVLQVKQVATETQISTTSDSDLLVLSITPSATTSNILVICQWFMGGNSNPNGGYKLTRGGTTVEGTTTTTGQYGGASGTFWSMDDHSGTNHSMESHSFNFLDTGPSGNGVNTTSAVEYKLVTDSFSQIYYNRNASGSGYGKSTMILMEIGA
jgi:hypothetical protein